MSVLVLILKTVTKPTDPNISNLQWNFSDPYFTVNIPVIDPPPNIPNNSSLTQQEYAENYLMRKALIYAQEGPYKIVNSEIVPTYQWTKLPCILVLDTSISNISPLGMKDRVESCLSVPQMDLTFLSTWSDYCNKYTGVTGTSSIDHGSYLKWTINPTANQAILYQTSTRDYIIEKLYNLTTSFSNFLNQESINGNLLSLTFVPNIVDFDITFAQSNLDYYKLDKCIVFTDNSSVDSAAPFLWFLLAIIIILVMAWCVLGLGF